jgi:hypothetical protein
VIYRRRERGADYFAGLQITHIYRTTKYGSGVCLCDMLAAAHQQQQQLFDWGMNKHIISSHREREREAVDSVVITFRGLCDGLWWHQCWRIPRLIAHTQESLTSRSTGGTHTTTTVGSSGNPGSHHLLIQPIQHTDWHKPRVQKGSRLFYFGFHGYFTIHNNHVYTTNSY